MSVLVSKMPIGNNRQNRVTTRPGMLVGVQLRVTLCQKIPATPRRVIFDLFGSVFRQIADGLNLQETDREVLSAKATFTVEHGEQLSLADVVVFRAVLNMPFHCGPALKRLSLSRAFQVNLDRMLPGAQVSYFTPGSMEYVDAIQAVSSAAQASLTLPLSLKMVRSFNAAQARVPLSSQHYSLIAAMRRAQQTNAMLRLLPFRKWRQLRLK